MFAAAGRSRARWWRMTAAVEARVHPILAAPVMWTVAGIIAPAGSGYIYNPDALHRLQI